MTRCIALLTDFGTADPYVGQMHGVLQRLVPHVHVIDLCHGVAPHAIASGALFLAASHRHFAPGTIFIGIVDPGVGSQRGLLLAHAHGCHFLAPDNGLLSLVLASDERATIHRLAHPLENWATTAHALLLGHHAPLADATAPHQKDNTPPSEWGDACPARASTPPSSSALHTAVASTFHGRDVLAPAAALLAAGCLPESMLHPISLSAVLSPPWQRATVTPHAIHTHALHIDHFGNILLSLTDAQRPELHSRWILTITPASPASDAPANPGKTSAPVGTITGPSSGTGTTDTALHTVRTVNTYADLTPGEMGLLCGSQGHAELACNATSAATRLHIAAGACLHLARETS